MKTVLLVVILILTALVAGPADGALGQSNDAARDPMAELVLSADELAVGAEPAATLLDGQLSIASTPFTSQVIEAPIPFNAVVPQWMGAAAETIELQVRTGPDGQTWGDWIAVHANHDWMEPDEAEIVGQMVLVPEAGLTHHFVQVRAFAAPPEAGEEPPALSQLRLIFIDTSRGPTAEELIDLQREMDAENPLLPESITSYPKPFVVSRAAWCRHADCVYSDGLEYHPVSHLIVHHTVSNNRTTDWPAAVRAIWNFHTFSRGWGDIGYNYLIDPNGVIYEGHYGGDNVVGTHASGANKGSMAASLLGTFTAAPTGIKPPPAMLNAAVELLAWKTDQRGINIFDASRTLPNISWGLPHLMGHRDVYGTTECPGDQAHLLIPWLRDQIAGRLGQQDPFLYADDATGTFTRSSTGNWYVPPYLCGFNNHAWYTWSTSNPALSTNWGEWRPNVPAAGRYRIDVFVPYCRTGRDETGSAVYTIQHADGVSTRTISQQADVGLWITLGEYNLRQGNGNVIRLTDVTRDDGLGVWFDAVRLLPLSTPPPPPPPVATNLVPTTDVWKTDRTVSFTWQVTNPETVQFTTLQVAVDYGFTNVLINQSWWGVVTTHSHTFGADYADLYWRVLLTRENAPLISSRPTRFSLDATPPRSSVRAPIFFLPRERRYHVSWSGDDALSGLDRYHVDVRAAGATGWTSWLSNTRLTSAQFTPPNAAQVYEFRAYGVDVAGNVERAPDGPDATTRGAVSLPYTLFQPVAIR
jgi:hypothetical protein